MDLITLVEKLAEALAGASILAAAIIALYIVVTAGTTFGIVYVIAKSIYKAIVEWISWLKIKEEKPRKIALEELPSDLAFLSKYDLERALSLIKKIKERGVDRDGIYEELSKILDLAADNEDSKIYSFQVERLYEELKRNRKTDSAAV